MVMPYNNKIFIGHIFTFIYNDLVNNTTKNVKKMSDIVN